MKIILILKKNTGIYFNNCFSADWAHNKRAKEEKTIAGGASDGPFPAIAYSIYQIMSVLMRTREQFY